MAFAGSALRHGLPLLVRVVRGRRPTASQAGQRLRRFLESRGLTYRKLGQYLAIRIDILPAELCRELDALLEGSTPMPSGEVEEIVRRDLGRPVAEIFGDFESDPIGSASVSQVHRAVSLDGEVLAVKVQRKGIRPRFRSEVRNLRRLARLCDLLRLAGRLSLRELVEEFADFTERELDFELEGASAEALSEGLAEYARAPRIVWELTSQRVLTMEYLEGVSLLTLCRLHEQGRADEIERLLPGVDLSATIDNLAAECLHQFFETGFFHGDPHPGNILLSPDGAFAFVDFGIFGHLSADMSAHLMEYIAALASGRFSDSAHSYASLCNPTPWSDTEAFEGDLTLVLRLWHDTLADLNATVEERHMGRWQGEIARVMRRHHVKSRPELLLVWRAMFLLDSTAIRLPGRFDVLDATVRFLRDRRRSPTRAVLGAIDEVRAEVPDLIDALRRTASRSRGDAASLHIAFTAQRSRSNEHRARRRAAAEAVGGAAAVVAASAATPLEPSWAPALAVALGALLLWLSTAARGAR